MLGPARAAARAALELAAALLMLATAWWIAHVIRHPRLTFFEDQLPGTLNRALLVPPGGVVVIGDSITAANYFPRLCGRPALNAGIGWATSHDWRPHAAELVRRARPAIVVVALGTDDNRSDWREDYRAIARLATFAVSPKQPDKAAFIRSLLPAVPVPAETFDGTHLTPAGAREWVRRIDAECERLGLAAPAARG